MSINAWTLRNLLDHNLRLTNPGLNVFIRYKNTVEDSNAYVEYGVQLSVTGNAGGFTDELIEPPPSVEPISTHNIGQSGGRLQFGAHTFDISHTWVALKMVKLGYDDGYKVFRDPSVIGLVYNSRLYSIEDTKPESLGNEIIRWFVSGNAIEPATPVEQGE